MSLRLCGHLKDDGLPCGSPALRDRRYCYFHQRQLQARISFARDRRRADICDWTLPPLTSPHDVQKALHRIMNELWIGRLDVERAGPMLNETRQAARLFWNRPERKRPAPKPLRQNILPASS